MFFSILREPCQKRRMPAGVLSDTRMAQLDTSSRGKDHMAFGHWSLILSGTCKVADDNTTIFYSLACFVRKTRFHAIQMVRLEVFLSKKERKKTRHLPYPLSGGLFPHYNYQTLVFNNKSFECSKPRQALRNCSKAFLCLLRELTTSSPGLTSGALSM